MCMLMTMRFIRAWKLDSFNTCTLKKWAAGMFANIRSFPIYWLISGRVRWLIIGFGIPQKYLMDRIASRNGSFKLVEKYKSGLAFMNAWLECNDIDRPDFITLEQCDLEDNINLTNIDVVLLLDALEHAVDPVSSLKMIQKNTRKDTYFIFSLPVGERVPVHSIDWETVEEIHEWLTYYGMQASLIEELTPDESVDQFVLGCKKRFSEAIFLATWS